MPRSVTPNYQLWQRVAWLQHMHHLQSEEYYLNKGPIVGVYSYRARDFLMSDTKLFLYQLGKKYRTLQPYFDHIIAEADLVNIIPSPDGIPYLQVQVEAYPREIWQGEIL